MLFANLLHLYQPANQQKDILEAVVRQSYLPIFRILNDSPNAKVTINLTGSLIELFDHYHYFELIDLIKSCIKFNKIELTGSCKYHAFLPLIPQKEVCRQINLNTETLQFYFGKDITLKGFFPPELGYFDGLLSILNDLNFRWVLLDEIAYSGGETFPDFNHHYKDSQTQLSVLFRERRVSNLIMSAVVRNSGSLLTSLKDDLTNKKYLITAMDGETFGHHRPGLENLLSDMFNNSNFKFSTLSDVLNEDFPVKSVSPICSTWASSINDIKNNIQFISWYDPNNMIHSYQWDFLNFVLDEFYKIKKTDTVYNELRPLVDIALASDHFWWASAKPWWSLEMIEDGAFKLLAIVKKLPNVSLDVLQRAQDFYSKIISTAFEWQRVGKVREMCLSRNEILRIPFKERTLERGGVEQGIYYAFIDLMKSMETNALDAKEYEKAILWRDAIYKLETKNDIYDTVHVVDLLRQQLPHEYIEKILDKYTKPYKNMRGGQPEQRDI